MNTAPQSTSTAPISSTAPAASAAPIAPMAVAGYAAPASVDAITPGMSNLGLGINAATGSLLDAYMQPVFDPGKVPAAVGQAIALNISTTTSLVEQNAYAYLTQQTLDVGIAGGYAGFSATLDTSFQVTQQNEYATSLATYTSLIQLYQLTIPSGAYQGLLSDAFAADLNDTTMSPTELYAKYGAYFTSTVVVGGSLSASIQTTSTSSFSSSTMAVDASAAFDDGISHGSVDTSYTYTDTATGTTYQCESGIVVVGGTASFDSSTGAFEQSAWVACGGGPPAFAGGVDHVR